MPLNLKDEEIDKRLQRIVDDLGHVGIRASKTDAIRWLLNIKYQGKKTHRKWKKLLR